MRCPFCPDWDDIIKWHTLSLSHDVTINRTLTINSSCGPDSLAKWSAGLKGSELWKRNSFSSSANEIECEECRVFSAAFPAVRWSQDSSWCCAVASRTRPSWKSRSSTYNQPIRYAEYLAPTDQPIRYAEYLAPTDQPIRYAEYLAPTDQPMRYAEYLAPTDQPMRYAEYLNPPLD